MEQQLRRAQDDLMLGGRWVFLFGIWDLLRILLMNLFSLDTVFLIYGIPADDNNQLIAIDIVWAAVALLVLLVRWYIYRRSRRECLRNSGWLYLLLASILSLLNLYDLVSSLVPKNSSWDLFYSASMFILGTASLISQLQVILAAFRIRKLRRQSGEV